MQEGDVQEQTTPIRSRTKRKYTTRRRLNNVSDATTTVESNVQETSNDEAQNTPPVTNQEKAKQLYDKYTNISVRLSAHHVKDFIAEISNVVRDESSISPLTKLIKDVKVINSKHFKNLTSTNEEERKDAMKKYICENQLQIILRLQYELLHAQEQSKPVRDPLIMKKIFDLYAFAGNIHIKYVDNDMSEFEAILQDTLVDNFTKPLPHTLEFVFKQFGVKIPKRLQSALDESSFRASGKKLVTETQERIQPAPTENPVTTKVEKSSGRNYLQQQLNKTNITQNALQNRQHLALLNFDKEFRTHKITTPSKNVAAKANELKRKRDLAVSYNPAVDHVPTPNLTIGTPGKKSMGFAERAQKQKMKKAVAKRAATESTDERPLKKKRV
jgi:hypothetical protein